MGILNFIDEVSKKLRLRLVMGFAPKATHLNGISGILTYVPCHFKLWDQIETEDVDDYFLLLLFFIEVKFAWHTISHFKVNKSVAFSAFTMLWNYHFYFQNFFIIPPLVFVQNKRDNVCKTFIQLRALPLVGAKWMQPVLSDSLQFSLSPTCDVGRESLS